MNKEDYTIREKVMVIEDEDHIAEGSVLTSMIKRVDITTYKEVVKAFKGNFNPGVSHVFLQAGPGECIT